ncbi:MAG: DUF1641 domain-containing protein [Actinobacteria bacterium]|nr:DUF1641 domain-containing protein [Actinomycetota bacterium]
MAETTIAEPSVAELSARLDRMADQMDFIAAELLAQRESRERWSELTETLVPVTRGAVDMATRELEDLSPDVTAEDAARFARTAARALPKLEVLLAQLDSLSELLHTVNSLSGAGMDKLTEVLAVADDKGYFAFARQGGMIADRVVTEFTEEDVKALGDNVVTILNAVKEMTQPEVMGLVQRTAISVSDAEDTPIEPPSLFALLKSMRDPQTRRGLAKVMAMLHTVGEESAPASTQGRK